MIRQQPTFSRRVFPLSAAQFLGVFNDSAFKMLSVLVVIGAAGNYFTDSIFMLLLTLVYVLPSLLFIMPAGFITDRLPKRYVMLLSKMFEVLILIFGAFALQHQETWGYWPILATMFLLAAQSAFFSPAVFGILPEVFHESEISHANGVMGASTFLATVLGIAFTPLIRYCFSGSYFHTVMILIAFSVLSFIFTLYTTQTISVVQRHRELAYHFRDSLTKGWKEMTRTHSLLLAALGDALFVSLGVAVLLLLGFFGKYSDALPVKLMSGDAALLRLAPMLGIVLGCWLMGRISSKKIELGMIPFGALGVTIFLLLGTYFPGAASGFTFSIPNICTVGYTVYIPAMCFFFLAGVNGGFFLVPVRAYFQQRVRPEARGAALAAGNALTFSMMLVINAIVLALAIGSAKNAPDMPAHLRSVIAAFPVISPRTLIAVIAVVTVAVTTVTMWLLPDFALRFLIITLGNLFYRIRATGTENIPERGPALLLANHTSYIDGILISSCTSRRVRFLMHEDFFSKPWLSWLARLTGFIKVPASGHKSIAQMFDFVKDALRNGDIVCVFPEGKLTRNGVIGRFAGGFEHMLPEDADVPVIPVNIGRIWGSLFSYYRGPIHFRLPKEFPYFTTLTFGAPMPRGTTPFEVRQKIAELAADSAQDITPHEHPVHYILAKNAKRHPFHVIIRDADTGTGFTFFKTYLASILFSREIRKRTPSDDKYVGVLLPNCTTAVLSIMGTLLADKVPCPLNFTTSQEILELSIRKAKMHLVLTSRRFIDKVRIKATPEMVFLEDLAKTIPAWKKIAAMIGIILLPYRELVNMIAPLSCNDNYGEAALLFSSGSTGIPKGVRLSHHNMYSDVFAMIQAIAFNPKRDSVFGNLPMFHSFGMSTGLWLPLIVRSQATVYVKSPLDATLTGEAIAKYKTTVLVATPSFLLTYLRKFKPEQFEPLRIVVSGAEKLRRDIADKFHEKLGGKLEIVEGYGCTELSPVVTINLAPNILDTGRKCGKPGAIGLGLESVCTRIMDPLTFQPVPPDTEGLLFIKGPMVMQGYLDDPEQTKKVLVDGYYNTGDIAKMDESGSVTICGRLSRFSKIAGEMVPHEMVECIINEMCGLEERVVAVASIPDAQKGEALLVLYTPAMPFTPDQIVEQLRERSISNLWIPKAPNFYPVEKLPLLGSGKLDLSVLRHIADEVAEQRKAKA